jgi:transposase
LTRCDPLDLTRFGHPRELMAYLGLVPSEYSSGRLDLQTDGADFRTGSE